MLSLWVLWWFPLIDLQVTWKWWCGGWKLTWMDLYIIMCSNWQFTKNVDCVMLQYQHYSRTYNYSWRCNGLELCSRRISCFTLFVSPGQSYIASIRIAYNYSKHRGIYSIPCQTKRPVYRGGRTSEGRNQRRWTTSQVPESTLQWTWPTRN